MLVIVVKGYPRVSETFITQEIAGLERRGVALTIASLRRPSDPVVHPIHHEIKSPVLYLPEYLKAAPFRVLAGHRLAFKQDASRYMASAVQWVHDLLRDPTPNRIRRFGQAGVLAAELPPGTRHLHAHFLHTPASVARYAATMTGLTYSLSGHAKDIWTCPAWELREKLNGARFCVTCTAANRDHLMRLTPGARIHLVYHGLDHNFFAPPSTFGSPRDGSNPSDPVRLLSVGRFQPKKGFEVVLQAMARLHTHIILTLVGYGPQERALRALAQTLGINHRLRWVGQIDHPGVRSLYRESDLFVLAPRVAADGDRDGLPNVVVEALSQGLPVVATRLSGIPEIVEDGVNGRLVPAEDAPALAAALRSLAEDPATRRRL
ncbi:MAG TPA: glycosyltransferase, partial [Candidatus Acidoferrum sp.]|nr:glycosyltransferase [Candidatus Acidoferrum sp.]